MMAQPISDADRKEISAWHGRWKELFFGQDFDRVGALYTDDAVMMPPNSPPVRGRDEILSLWRGVNVFEIDIVIDEIEGYDDLAYVLGSFSMTFQPEGASRPIEDRGKYIEIRRRQSDGRWPMSRDIFNSDLEAPGS